MQTASREKRLHSTAVKPFSYYVSNIPEYFPSVPMHWHGELELNYILEGEGVYVCNERRFTAGKGDIVIITPNLLHAIYPSGEAPHIYDTFVFDPSMLGSYDNDREAMECIRPIISGSISVNSHITPSHIYYEEIKTTVENIISSAKGDTPLLDMLIKSELLRLFWLLYESGDAVSCDPESVKRDDVIRPVLQFINEHYQEAVTNEQLAAVAHLSKSYFMAAFKKATGTSAMLYVNQLRLRSAREMLSEGASSISQIAYLCGFRNLSNFNRQFRRAYGSSPAEFRKRKPRANQ